MTTDHKEKEFEQSIVQHLVDHGGYVEGKPEDFDPKLALLPQALMEFVKDSQPEAWERLETIHQAAVEDKFINRLCKELDSHGMLHVIRHGITDYGVHVDCMYSAPHTGLNPEAVELYKSNVLTVIRQLNHSEKNPHDAVDLAFFINGLPAATA